MCTTRRGLMPMATMRNLSVENKKKREAARIAGPVSAVAVGYLLLRRSAGPMADPETTTGSSRALAGEANPLNRPPPSLSLSLLRLNGESAASGADENGLRESESSQPLDWQGLRLFQCHRARVVVRLGIGVFHHRRARRRGGSWLTRDAGRGWRFGNWAGEAAGSLSLAAVDSGCRRRWGTYGVQQNPPSHHPAFAVQSPQSH
ncbi:hypothetical protein B0H15DRAFT_363080 [Mycena belliarum]|uniref:Uncharacterized protein n=1 Tax=Mycena belliarum TaxID=1033014 RepID=A0AAD6U0B5_9AGAR|nr:hypothetical protein B0H15DRAFT_363080 [Mycena belliae]